MSSQITVIYERRSRRRWAAIGFILIVALTIIAWFIAPSVIDWLKGMNANFRNAAGTMQPLYLQLAFTAAVFLVLTIVVALIVTLGAPKKAINVNERELVRERLDNVKYHRKQKKRQRKINREMRDYNEKNLKK